MSRVKVGTIGVDAGCVWLVDPCYVLDEKTSGPEKWNKGWKAHCETLDVLDTPARAGEFEDGIVVSSGYGDGEYPVYVTYEHGRVKRVTIEFMED